MFYAISETYYGGCLGQQPGSILLLRLSVCDRCNLVFLTFVSNNFLNISHLIFGVGEYFRNKNLFQIGIGIRLPIQCSFLTVREERGPSQVAGQLLENNGSRIGVVNTGHWTHGGELRKRLNISFLYFMEYFKIKYKETKMSSLYFLCKLETIKNSLSSNPTILL